MKYFTIIFCLFLIPFISFGKKKKKVHHADEVQYVANIREYIYALKKTGIDTILIYQNGCIGCIAGTVDATHICWKHNGNDSCKIINNYGLNTPPYRAQRPFNYFFDNEKSIREQHFDTGIWESHYYYVALTVLINGNEYYKVHIPEYYQLLYDDSRLMNYIYRMEYAISNDRL